MPSALSSSLRWPCVVVLWVLSWSEYFSAAKGETQCELAIVGAGPGGAYAAWRASLAGKHVCVYEMSGRPGGRIHSMRGQGPKKDLVVEAGAYRFTATKICNKEFITNFCVNTPITRATVKELGLSVAEYDPDPSQWDFDMRKIVDQHGNNAGFITLPETLLEQAAAHGAEINYNAKVVSLLPTGEGVDLVLAAGAGVVSANAVLLNIPQAPMLKLLQSSGGGIQNMFPEPLYRPTSSNMVKLYIYYEDAWWRNDLSLRTGHFSNTKKTDVTSSTVGAFHAAPAPLEGQYHDGDIRCDLPGGKCRGYLQAYYAHDIGGYQYYKTYHPLLGDAAAHLTYDRPDHSHLLTSIHRSLVEFHKEALDKANATEKVSRMLPHSGILSIWSELVDGFHAACHHHDLIDSNFSRAAVQPLGHLPIFVANEAFGPNACWAEGSLNMSHLALERLGIPGQHLPEPWVALPYPNPPSDPFFLQGERSQTVSPSSQQQRAAALEAVSV